MLLPMTTLSGQDLRSRDPRLPLHRRLADALTEAIRRGEYSPSDPLPSESEIARTLGVSRSPVREAIAHLEQEGLVTSQPYRGKFVANITAETISEIYSLRRVLECFAAELAVTRLQPNQLEQMRMQDVRAQKEQSRQCCNLQ